MKNFVPLDGPKKTIIRNDWLKEFPDFRKKRECSIGKIVGPVSVSVGWEIRYKEYRAGSSVCNLMNVEEGLYASLRGQPGYRRNALSWEQHEKGLYKEAIEEIKKNSPIPLEGPITLSQLLEAYALERKKGLYYLPQLEDPILVSGWAGKEDIAREIAQEFFDLRIKNADKLDDEVKKKYIHKEEIARQDILAKALNPSYLTKLIDEAIIKYKLQKLPQEELIIDF